MASTSAENHPGYKAWPSTKCGYHWSDCRKSRSGFNSLNTTKGGCSRITASDFHVGFGCPVRVELNKSTAGFSAGRKYPRRRGYGGDLYRRPGRSVPEAALSKGLTVFPIARNPGVGLLRWHPRGRASILSQTTVFHLIVVPNLTRVSAGPSRYIARCPGYPWVGKNW